jgi:hypothetical protein
VVILAAVYGFGFLFQPWISDGWGTAMNLAGGAIVLAIGVTLIERYRRWRGIDADDSRH